MVVYNKAVRDRIPEIILRDGKNPSYKSLDDAAFLVELEKKLGEEVAEYLESKKVEELVDIEEILLRIIELKSCSLEHFNEIRLRKRKERGGFSRNLYLESVDVSSA